MAEAIDIVLYGLFAFVGTAGVTLTGFGHAIIYIFVWQIAVLAGFDSEFKYAIFLQALSLLAAQPLIFVKAGIFQHASRRMLLYFVPVTIVATPIGQYTGQQIGTDTVELVGGILVSFVACFEVYQKRNLFRKWGRHSLRTLSCGKLCPKTAGAETGEPAEAPEAAAAGQDDPERDDAGNNNNDNNKKDDEDPAPARDEESSSNDEGGGVGAEKTSSSAATGGDGETAVSSGGEAPAEEESKTAELTDDDSNDLAKVPFTLSTVFWTLFAGFCSGFLGGLCGIRGPPIILYFLHPPAPIRFPNKRVQRATGASITLTNVTMRVVYYLINTLAYGTTNNFQTPDWPIYVALCVCSVFGVLVGSKLFDRLKDNQDPIKGILTVFLLLCGISLLISSLSTTV